MENGKKTDAHLVKDSKVKELVKTVNMRVSSDYYEALSRAVGKLIIKSCLKAKEDKRMTIRSSDVVID